MFIPAATGRETNVVVKGSIFLICELKWNVSINGNGVPIPKFEYLFVTV